MKKKVIISLIVVVIAAVLICLPGLFLKSKSSKKETLEPEEVSPEVIWEDYNAGKISIDDFVKKSIDNPSDYVCIDLFICNNIDQLSESTLTYYLDKIQLKNVSFGLDKENDEKKSSKNGLFAKPVYAAEEDTLYDLNQVVQSPQGNFVVWYTTTGESAITKEDAERIANELEDSIKSYKLHFGRDYTFESDTLSRFLRYKDQQRVLAENGIDTACLENTMQVYVLDYDNNENNLAKYVSRRVDKKIKEYALDTWGKDKLSFNDGSIILPYILVKPSSLSDIERSKQVINHEMFHHYQYEILDGALPYKDERVFQITDELIYDATANWASALITPHDTIEGFLNEHAHTARKYADRLLSDEMIDKYGKDGLSYSLFVYLYNYMNNVDKGATKIIESIYQDDGFLYLQFNSTYAERARVQEEVALRDLSQDYENKNLIAAPSLESTVPIKAENPEMGHVFNSTLTPFAIEFYKITDTSLQAKMTGINNVAAYLIKYQDGKYEVIDKVTTLCDEYVFDLTEYDCQYLAVANLGLTYNSEYQVSFSTADKAVKDTTSLAPTSTEETTTTEEPTTSTSDLDVKNYISYETTNHWNEEILRDIETYYFDENGFVCGRTVTLYIAEEEGLMDAFVRNVTDSYHLYTNVKIEGNMLQYDFTEEAIIQGHDNERTKESIIGFYEVYEGPGGGNVDGYVRTDYNPKE